MNQGTTAAPGAPGTAGMHVLPVSQTQSQYRASTSAHPLWRKGAASPRNVSDLAGADSQETLRDDESAISRGMAKLSLIMTGRVSGIRKASQIKVLQGGEPMNLRLTSN
jgi:hypothetical protein